MKESGKGDCKKMARKVKLNHENIVIETKWRKG